MRSRLPHHIPDTFARKLLVRAVIVSHYRFSVAAITKAIVALTSEFKRSSDLQVISLQSVRKQYVLYNSDRI